jgi:hypothetical protein
MGKPLDCAALREAVETWPELDRLRRLREAIRHWAVGPHAQWCTTRADCPCDCGASDEFEARLTARRLVGLEDGEL